MKKLITSVLLTAVVVNLFTGCANTSATTNSTSESSAGIWEEIGDEKVVQTSPEPAEEIVSQEDSSDKTEIEAETTVETYPEEAEVAEVSSEFNVSDYDVSNGLYDPSEKGAWTWAEIDAYLSSFPNIDKYWTDEGYLDLDLLAGDLGCEPFFDTSYYDNAVYWLERGDLKLTFCLSRNNSFDVFLEDDKETVRVLSGVYNADVQKPTGASKILCDYFDEDPDRWWYDREASLIFTKATAAKLIYVSTADKINVMHLPSVEGYAVVPFGNKLGMSKSFEFLDTKYRQRVALNVEETKIPAP